MRQAHLVLTFLLLTLTPAWAKQASPSFACADAHGPIESLICRSPELAQLDREMATFYRATRHGGVVDKHSQVEWLKHRDACSGADPAPCLKARMEERIMELHGLLGISSTERVASFEFTGECTIAYLDIVPDETDNIRRMQLPDTLDCTLSDGTQLRVRYGAAQALPYGACGGDPPKWFSLWVNQRRVISKHDMGGHCVPTTLESIRADAQSIRICEYKPKYGDGHAPQRGDDPDALQEKAMCSVIAVNPAMPIDRIEYPADPRSAVNAGTLVADMEKDRVLCRSVVSADGTHLAIPSDATTPEWHEWARSDPFKSTQHAVFDFGNEGVDREVYGWDFTTRIKDGGIYLTLPKGSPEPDMSAGDSDGPLPPHGKRWDLDAWHGEVFRRNGTTYVLATPSNDEEALYLWQPQPDETMRDVCKWHRAEQHF